MLLYILNFNPTSNLFIKNSDWKKSEYFEMKKVLYMRSSFSIFFVCLPDDIMKIYGVQIANKRLSHLRFAYRRLIIFANTEITLKKLLQELSDAGFLKKKIEGKNSPINKLCEKK